MKYKVLILIIVLLLFGGLLWHQNKRLNDESLSQINKDKQSQMSNLLSPSPLISPSPSPSPSPLSFAQMDELYGPCVYAPVLMYHHIQTPEEAQAENAVSLTVNTDIFAQQMQYLQDRDYNPISMADLNSFFDQGAVLPAKPIMITFDDGYNDIYSDAWPILRDHQFKATVFLITGLVENYGYLTWNQVNEMKGNIFFGNHTWSHKNVGSNFSEVQTEITTADNQLTEYFLNNPKVFCYPYGSSTSSVEKLLQDLGYGLAFTTRSGSILCAKNRLSLPRIRVGSTSLAGYGL